MRRKKTEDEQPGLPFDGGVENVSITFRKLYYPLYTNSQSSRAERLVSDLSLLLLSKRAVEVRRGAHESPLRG